jgi:aminotransferase
MLTLSTAAESILQSEIRVMSVECEKVHGINLAQGVCDTEVPKPVRDAAWHAMEYGLNSYTRLDGIALLRNAIAKKVREHNGISADPEGEIIVTAGATGAFYCACLALLNAGDEVIIFEPYYGYHVNTLEALKLKPVYVQLEPPNWTFGVEDLERVTTSRTRAIVVNTPANPCGKVFSLKELEMIAAWAEANDAFILTDEIYEHFVYDRARHISPGSLPGMRDRTITISGFSKVFSVTGWRVGYAVVAPQWATAMGYYHDLIYICAPAPLQMGCAAGLEELGPQFYNALRDEYARKRRMTCDALASAGLTPYEPQGAYYVLADSSRVPGTTSKEKAMWLLKETGVASVPGESFYQGDGGENLLRVCFAKKDYDLEQACKRLTKLKL